MVQGLATYRRLLGQPFTVAGLVGIFETGPDVDPVSVEGQVEFQVLWRKSQGRTVVAFTISVKKSERNGIAHNSNRTRV